VSHGTLSQQTPVNRTDVSQKQSTWLMGSAFS
jgi:hypothetical protein